MKETRELKKISDNVYELTLVQKDGKVITKAKYSKAEMRDNLNRITNDLQMGMVRRAQMEKDIKKMDIEDTPELRQMIENIKKAQLLEKKAQVEEQMKGLVIDLKKMQDQKDEIKRVLPELFRGKK